MAKSRLEKQIELIWTAGKKEEKILEATVMQILRRIEGVTLRDESVAIP